MVISAGGCLRKVFNGAARCMGRGEGGGGTANFRVSAYFRKLLVGHAKKQKTFL